jgi:hypothetical protein
MNVDDFDFLKIARFPFSLSAGMARKMKKRWQYLGCFDEKLVVGVAVIHLGYIGSAFAYCFDKEKKETTEIDLLDPGAGSTIYSESSVDSFSALSKGKKSVRLINDTDHGPRRIEVDSPKLRMRIEMPDSPDDFTPLVACIRNVIRGFNYTHKAAGLPASGWVEVKGKRIELGEKALGVLDWTSGCASRETFWNWASAAGHLPDGRVIGINLCYGLGQSGFTENVIWIDGKPIKVDIVHFEYDFDNPMGPWRIWSEDKKVDLAFQPEGERREEKNFLLVVSRFRQPFGAFTGKLQVGSQKADIDNIYGFAEEHFVKW